MKRRITPEDIMPLDQYAPLRAELRRSLIERKKTRRLAIGPYATAQFENYDTMWHQVQEMLFVEKGGEAQLEGELAAYNPLIPNGTELTATVMFEVEDPTRRQRLLALLGGVETMMGLEFAGERVVGQPEADVERTTAEGKASSVQFLHFPFSAAQIDKFRQAGTQVLFAIRHPGYEHAAALPESMRAALALDFA